MLSFAQKPKVPQQTTPARSIQPDWMYSGQSRGVATDLHQQRALGNRALRPSLLPHHPELAVGAITAGPTRFHHDFSQVPVSPRQREDGRRFPADEGISGRALEHKRIGVGQNGAELAPEVNPFPEEFPEAMPEGPVEAEAPQVEEGEAPEAGCAINSRTAVHAPDGTPDTRTTIGVCETVGFNVGGRLVDWTANTGWPQARSGRANFDWAAPERPGISTITATDPATGESCSIDMEVVAPAGLRFRTFDVLAYPAGTAGAGMELTVHARPRNVNFGWIAIREDSGPASRISGYFAARPAASLRHEATPDFRRMGWDNSLAPNAAGDLQGDTAATVSGTLPRPWSDGSFQWIIPTRYRCSNSTGNGRVFTHVQQRFIIEGDGTVTVTKHAARVERTP
jgi:hypothetical protein